MSTQKLRVKSLSGQAKEAILQYIEEMDLKTDNKLPREEATCRDAWSEPDHNPSGIE